MRTSQHGKRILELGASVQEQIIDVICIQEHQICHKETAAEVDYIDVCNNWMFTCSSSKNDDNASIGGIGMLLSPSAF